MTTKENGLIKIQDLVQRFNEQLPAYKKADYNETKTRRDFIDPFFKALGWDIDNEQGYAESYREVIHEDKIKIGGSTKAPDYSFRLSGSQRLFFVEAKKPSVVIKDDIQPAYQVRRYGWNAQLNVSIITDFEEFAIYDCTKKPNPTDKSSVARIKYITFNNYEQEWDFLWDTFSKEAVLKGRFDKYIAGNANKKGTATVDKDFLNTLDQWRALLAENLIKDNKQLDEEELNYAVQQTIDRLIFLRICEARGIEPYGTLHNAIKTGEYYKNLLLEFKYADDKYNSGLFNFKKDTLSHSISINNKVLKTIINQLYYPESPYEFSVISVEILGSVYEQFLGKTITINNKAKAVIELKPEVRKAGGVYYTPQYIVDYIVANTIGSLIQNKTPSQVSAIKIVDPACGSGSFLLGAYQFLLNWHKEYYTKNPAKKNPLTPDGNLATAEKKRILLNNIYGVDIDTNAVEVTKLSLLLKCMEGETQASIAHQMSMFNDRVLPTLENNIKSGNSLIDTDYYDSQLDFGEERKIKPFNWQKAFPEVFNRIIEDDTIDKENLKIIAAKVKKQAKKTLEYAIELEQQLNIVGEPEGAFGSKFNGGFDVVIGNPPYVKEYTSKETFDNIKKSHLKKYYQGKMDLWYFFACYGIDMLNKNGKLGYIVPNNWVTNAGATILRNKILKDATILNIIDFGSYMVFENASIQTMILILDKTQNENYTFDYRKIEVEKPNIDYAYDAIKKTSGNGIKILQPKLIKANLIDKYLNFSDTKTEKILERIKEKSNFSLNEKEVIQGIVSPQDEVNNSSEKILNNVYLKGTGIFVINEFELQKLQLNDFESQIIKPYFTTNEINRYNLDHKNQKWIIYTTSEFKNQNIIAQFPLIKKHLDKFKSVITSDNKPYGLHRSRDQNFFIGEKIVSQRKCIIPSFSFVDFDSYVSQTFNLIKTKRINLVYLTAILNSDLIAFWLRNRGKMQGNNYQIDKEPLLQIPIHITNNNDIKELICRTVKQLVELNTSLKNSKLPSQQERIKTQIEYLELKINKHVYEIYGITEEDAKIIAK